MGRSRGSIKKRGSTWLVTVYIGQRPNGQRGYRYSTVEGSQRAAQRELTKMLRGLDDGTLPSSTHETFDAFLGRWLESKKAGLSGRTERDYRYLLKTHVRPTIGAARLAELRPAHSVSTTP